MSQNILIQMPKEDKTTFNDHFQLLINTMKISSPVSFQWAILINSFQKYEIQIHSWMILQFDIRTETTLTYLDESSHIINTKEELTEFLSMLLILIGKTQKRKVSLLPFGIWLQNSESSMNFNPLHFHFLTITQHLNDQLLKSKMFDQGSICHQMLLDLEE